MKINYIALIFITSISLTGCLTTANMIKHPNQAKTNSQYAPQSEKQSDGIGVVSYLNEGAEFVTKSRREDAYKQAFNACQGEYDILKETASYTDPTYVSRVSGNSIQTTGFNSEYIYIYFKCKH